MWISTRLGLYQFPMPSTIFKLLETLNLAIYVTISFLLQRPRNLETESFTLLLVDSYVHINHQACCDFWSTYDVHGLRDSYRQLNQQLDLFSKFFWSYWSISDVTIIPAQFYEYFIIASLSRLTHDSVKYLSGCTFSIWRTEPLHIHINSF